MTAFRIFAAALLIGLTQRLCALEPTHIELGLYAQEQAFRSSGAVIGVNPSTLESDETGVILCNPGLNCDRLSIRLTLPQSTLQVFPLAQLRIRLDWISPTMLPVDDFDMYLYDLDGNLLGRADRTTITDGPGEELLFPIAQIPEELVLEIYYFLSLAASYNGNVLLDLGPSAEGADPDTFWADNPPPAARNGGDPRRFGAGGGVWVMLLLALARGSGRRRQT